ncbi:hypothetical protein LEP1GSC061_3796 [Leptospira wolffii serovar Khorat str. Khorat-H2]|nr:hypothetical protein LEP1GSC061_3796 [Leptospira wolffii serovar Khorat str. Khorat-H2]
MSRSYLEKIPLVFVPGSYKIGTMTRFLLVLVALVLFENCEPADPEFRRKAWENVTESGFISNDYFQVVVTVPIPNQERPLLELREECKARAVRKRDELSINLILAQITEERKIFVGVGTNSSVPKYEPPLPPAQAIRTPSSATPGTGSIATQTVQNAQNQTDDTEPQEKKEKKKTEIVNADYLAYRAAFSWLLDRLFLYREDYGDQKRCTLVYRIVEADLLKRILESPITR